jgi:hypothetical protein
MGKDREPKDIRPSEPDNGERVVDVGASPVEETRRLVRKLRERGFTVVIKGKVSGEDLVE